MNGILPLLAMLLLAWSPLCVFAQPGEMAQAAPGAEDTLAEPSSPGPQQRVQERRRQREEEREWIAVPEMDRDTLRGLLADPNVAVLDVTCKERGVNIPDQIPGAVWRDCTQVGQWASQYRKDQTIVVYCA